MSCVSSAFSSVVFAGGSETGAAAAESCVAGAKDARAPLPPRPPSSSAADASTDADDLACLDDLLHSRRYAVRRAFASKGYCLSQPVDAAVACRLLARTLGVPPCRRHALVRLVRAAACR
eukprot:Rhum_TRINITY_DN4785_c0_g1::Rhum_TRINITY_DN4785_c0_g1_i1::g.15683::m.15683